MREWVTQIRPTHLLLDDPLRTKVQSFGLLSREEQIAWMTEDAPAALVAGEPLPARPPLPRAGGQRLRRWLRRA